MIQIKDRFELLDLFGIPLNAAVSVQMSEHDITYGYFSLRFYQVTRVIYDAKYHTAYSYFSVETDKITGEIKVDEIDAETFFCIEYDLQ